VPKALQDGILLTRISTKKQQKLLFRLDSDRGQLTWESKACSFSVKNYQNETWAVVVRARPLQTP
jgi:hypothetical protein